ncbi:MAG: DNA methyltransferase, partial [Dongiaceae bacterium]
MPELRPSVSTQGACGQCGSPDLLIPDPVPSVVLDCFAGSGTVGVVCAALGRDFIGIELSERYAEMA